MHFLPLISQYNCKTQSIGSIVHAVDLKKLQSMDIGGCLPFSNASGPASMMLLCRFLKSAWLSFSMTPSLSRGVSSQSKVWKSTNTESLVGSKQLVWPNKSRCRPRRAARYNPHSLKLMGDRNILRSFSKKLIASLDSAHCFNALAIVACNLGCQAKNHTRGGGLECDRMRSLMYDLCLVSYRYVPEYWTYMFMSISSRLFIPELNSTSRGI